MRRIETERFEEIIPECIDMYETLWEKQQEMKEIEESREEEPSFFENIEHYYGFTDNEEFRQMQLEHLRERIHEIEFSLYTQSKRLEREGMPHEVWIVYDGYKVMLPFIEKEGDYLKVQGID